MKDLLRVWAIIGVIEKAMVAFFMALLELSRIKRQRAEDELAKNQSDASVKDAHEAIDKANEGKSDAQVIDDFLNGKSGDPGPGK